MPKEKPSVAKAVQPSATLEIDGVKFELLYDYNAIADAEIVVPQAAVKDRFELALFGLKNMLPGQPETTY